MNSKTRYIIACVATFIFSYPAAAVNYKVPEGAKKTHILFPEDNVNIELPTHYTTKRVRDKYFSVKTGQKRGVEFIDISKEEELYDYSYKSGVETKLNGRKIYYSLNKSKSLSDCPQTAEKDIWFPYKNNMTVVIRGSGCFESFGMADFSILWHIADQIMTQE